MTRWIAIPVLAAAIAAAGCDIVTADFRAEQTAEWHKTYTLDPKGRVEIYNVNGRIVVEASAGNTVDVDATKKAHGTSEDAAKAALDRVNITEEVSSGRIRIDTRVKRADGLWFMSGGTSVEYHVKVPAGADAQFTTVNGRVEIDGLNGAIVASTTNGGVKARNVGGHLEASTTNGGVEADLARMPDGGVKLECVNGGIEVSLPHDSKATISASIRNGGIHTSGLDLDSDSQRSRRHFEARLNGGGPRLEASGVNGGIKLIGR